MVLQANPASFVMASLAIVCLCNALSFKRRYDGVGANTYALTMVALAFWQVAYALEMAATTLPTDMLFAQISYLGVVLVPPLWFTFGLQYATWGRHPKLGLLLLLFVVPLITLGIVVLRPVGGLVWKNVTLVTAGPFPIMVAEYGPWFWVHALYSYALMVAGAALFMAGALCDHRARLATRAHVTVAALLPLLANLAYILGSPTMRVVDTTPVALAFSLLWLVSNLQREGLMPVVSLGHLAIMNHLADGVLLTDVAGRVVEANDAALEMLGTDHDALVGCLPDAVLCFDGNESVLSQAEQDRVTLSLHRPEGERVLRVHVSPIHDAGDRHRGHILLLEDITECYAAEQDLRVGLARLRILVDNLHRGVLVLGHDMEVLICNDLFVRLFSLDMPSQSLEGVRAKDVCDMVASAFADRVGFQACWAACSQGKPITSHQMDLADGRTVECNGYVVEAKNSQVGFVWLWQDVTLRRAMQQSAQGLVHMEMIGKLAGGMAHEYNNLLTAILGYAEILRARVHDQPEAVGDVAQIAAAGERAAELTHRLLAYSRRQMLFGERIEVSQHLLDLAPTILKQAAQIDRAMVEFVPAVQTLWVHADREQLGQVVLELATNALDATPEGGRVVLGTERIDLSAERSVELNLVSGSYAVIYVSDTGPGISPAVAEHIFEPFYSTKEVGQGTGLGLAMVYGFMQQSNGTVDFWTQPGEGTVFRLYFPLQEPPSS